MMSGLPLVSVVMTTYNYGKYLKRSLSSVLAQDFPATSREIIIIDDGSTDDTQTILSEFGDQVRSIRQQNSGQAVGINRALEIAQGDIVAFLDPDDEWYPHKLKRIVPEFEDREVGMVQHLLDVKKSVRRSNFRFYNQLSSGKIGVRTLTPDFRSMPTSALSFRTDILRRFLPAPASLKTGADWYFCVLVALVSKISAILEPLGVYWVHETNFFTSNRTAASFRQQILTIETVRERAVEVALSEGMKIPGRFEASLYSEYPVFCRINLAWHEKKFAKIPSYFWNYFRKYAIKEYGWSLRLLRRSFRMAACGLIPPPIYRWLGFYSHA
jgi:glycosyltransferase involved in cell wall biosynthesis